MSVAQDVRADEGLRQALRDVARVGSWDGPAGQWLLREVRERAVRNAAHVASATGVGCDRGLVDDVVAAAWIVLDRYAEQVLATDHPWAYVMSAAQQEVMHEAIADRAVTSPTTTSGRNRQHAWSAVVARVGAAAGQVAAALGHGRVDEGSRERLGIWAPRVGRRGEPLLVEQPPKGPGRLREREGWYAAFVGLLVEYGADESVTVAAVDHLADLFTATPRKHWEDAARSDPVLVRLGLTPDQCGALVALLAGSRRDREAGRGGGLLGAVRTDHDRGVPVELTAAEQRRVRTYVDGSNPAHRRSDGERRLPVLGESVRAEMARSGVTQEMIAARLGIRRQNVSTRLVGIVAWTTDELAAVADLLEVPVARLLNDSLAQSRSLSPQGDAPGKSRVRSADRTMTPARPVDRLTALAR
jgi:hypothetical protein